MTYIQSCVLNGNKQPFIISIWWPFLYFARTQITAKTDSKNLLQVALCTCRQKFKVMQVGVGKYRVSQIKVTFCLGWIIFSTLRSICTNSVFHVARHDWKISYRCRATSRDMLFFFVCKYPLNEFLFTPFWHHWPALILNHNCPLYVQLEAKVGFSPTQIRHA
jgi:hypothetical protein